MKIYMFLFSLFLCTTSYGQSAIVCEDGNKTKAYKIQVQIDLDRATVSYEPRTTPCYVDPYDGYECDNENPHVYVEKVIEWPAQIILTHGTLVTSKQSIVSARLNTDGYEPPDNYKLNISERLASDDTIIKLSISGTLNLKDLKFISGFEKDFERVYVSVNTLYLHEIDRFYYLKCTGLD